MQDKWLALTEKHNMGKRRLARSIEAGRVRTPKVKYSNPTNLKSITVVAEKRWSRLAVGTVRR